MAQHGRGRIGILALDEVQIAMAHAGRRGGDQHLMGAWLVDLDLFDDQRGRDALQDGCLHGACLTRNSRTRPVQLGRSSTEVAMCSSESGRTRSSSWAVER